MPIVRLKLHMAAWLPLHMHTGICSRSARRSWSDRWSLEGHAHQSTVRAAPLPHRPPPRAHGIPKPEARASQCRRRSVSAGARPDACLASQLWFVRREDVVIEPLPSAERGWRRRTEHVSQKAARPCLPPPTHRTGGADPPPTQAREDIGGLIPVSAAPPNRAQGCASCAPEAHPPPRQPAPPRAPRSRGPQRPGAGRARTARHTGRAASVLPQVVGSGSARLTRAKCLGAASACERLWSTGRRA